MGTRANAGLGIAIAKLPANLTLIMGYRRWYSGSPIEQYFSIQHYGSIPALVFGDERRYLSDS